MNINVFEDKREDESDDALKIQFVLLITTFKRCLLQNIRLLSVFPQHGLDEELPRFVRAPDERSARDVPEPDLRFAIFFPIVKLLRSDVRLDFQVLFRGS